MWIDRLEFIGFGNLTGQRIDFAPGRLSVVVQPNEYGKSTMSEAIWSVLFDYPPDSSLAVARKPLSGAAFKACLVLSLQEQHIRVIRNFSDHSLTVLDLMKDPSKKDADITSQFASAIAAGTFGEEITGLTRDLFRTTCFVHQRQLGETPFADNRALSSLLLSVADTGSAKNNVFDAIGALEEKLTGFTFKGKAVSADDLIATLETQRDEMSESLKTLECERQNCDRDVERLGEVEERLLARLKVVNADEYFELCLESADIDTRLSRAQERLAKIAELQNQMASLEQFATFPIDRQRHIEEMWLKRQARAGDLKRLQMETQAKSADLQKEKAEQRMLAENLSKFTLDDAHMIASLARTLEQVDNELAETRNQYQAELQRVRGTGVNLDMFSDLRRALLSLEPRELDDLHAIHAMAVGARERQTECIMSFEKSESAVNEIAWSREHVYNAHRAFFWVPLIASLMTVIPIFHFIAMEKRSLADPLSEFLVGFFVLCVVLACACLWRARKVRGGYRIDDEEHAKREAAKYQKLARDLQTKINSLEMRIEALAQKAKLPSGNELVQTMQAYAVHATQFKELDFLEHLLKNRDQRAEQLRAQIKPYFYNAKRALDNISAGDALQLSEDIMRVLGGTAGSGDLSEHHRLSEIEFLSDELKEIDNILRQDFVAANVPCNSLEEGYMRFGQGADAFRRFEALKNEYDLLTDDSSVESMPSELPRAIERLEAKRMDVWARMQELLSENPEIMHMLPPSEGSTRSRLGKEMSDLRASVDELRRDKDDLIVQIRAAMKNYQDNYFRITEQLESVERDLEHVRHTRAALTLARNTLLRLADENHAVWSDKLTDIARDMFRHLGTEYEALEFDSSMRISVRRKGQREPLDDWHIRNQLSAGTREQLHWLARMTVLQYLSGGKSLPVILDEPFSEFDDERFVKIMRFLLNTISRNHQVIIFSCHQQRHEWLLEQLDPNERQAIEICRLAPLKSDGAVVRR